MITEKDLTKCIAAIAEDNEYLAKCQRLPYFPLVVDEYKGARITDVDGNEFIDFLASASSMNLGGQDQHVADAVRAQLDKFTQYVIPYSYNETTTGYARRLASKYPGGVKARMAFSHGGSDSNDAAVKFARAYTGRQQIIVFRNAYHGTTFGAASMSTVTSRQHAGMGPFLQGIHVFPFFGIDQPDDVVERDCLKEIESAFAGYLPPNEVAAVIIEPIQGDAGILPGHPIFMHRLYDMCKENGILFIAEEVQQAFWRSGKFFGIEHYEGIIPDGIVLGKSAGAGLTLGGFLARAEVADALPAPGHICTLGGNPLACAAGSAAFDYYETQEFQQKLAENIKVMDEENEKLQTKYPEAIASYRQLGLQTGVDVVGKDGKLDEEGTFKILFRAYQRGLVMMSLMGTVLRIQPPLIIDASDIRNGYEIIGEAIADHIAGDIPDDVMRYSGGW